MLSGRQFGYSLAWRYCVVFVVHLNCKDLRFYSWNFVFMVSSQATAVACYTMGGVASHPSSHMSAPGWDVFCGRTSHSDSSFISPFGKDKVLFCRFLSNTETRVSCSLNSPFLDFSYTCDVFFLIILGCGYYFELLSGCALMVLLAAALNPTTPHRTLPSHAGRYCARILSYRQFEYLPSWKYCVVSFSSNIRHASFILWFRFMFLSGTSQLLDRFMGCGRYHPSPHITDPNWTVLCAIFVLRGESNIFRGYCVVFRFSLELLGQASPLVRFRISFSWISLSRIAASIGSMGVLGHVSATNIL